MTPRRATTGEWAEKLASAQTCPSCAEQYGMGDNGNIVHVPSVASLLLKEQHRSVRIVKAEIKRVTLNQHQYNKLDKEVRLEELNLVLSKLTRGR